MQFPLHPIATDASGRDLYRVAFVGCMELRLGQVAVLHTLDPWGRSSCPWAPKQVWKVWKEGLRGFSAPGSSSKCQQ